MKNNKIVFLLLIVGSLAAGTLCADWRQYNGMWSDEQALELAIAQSLVEAYNGNFSEQEALDQAIAKSLKEPEEPEETVEAEEAEEVEQDGPRCLENQCPICLEEYQDDDEVMMLPCGHSVHASCMNSSIEHGYNRCSICRGSAQGDGIVIDSYQNLRPTDAAQEQAAEIARAQISRNRPPVIDNGIRFEDGWGRWDMPANEEEMRLDAHLEEQVAGLRAYLDSLG